MVESEVDASTLAFAFSCSWRDGISSSTLGLMTCLYAVAYLDVNKEVGYMVVQLHRMPLLNRGAPKTGSLRSTAMAEGSCGY